MAPGDIVDLTLSDDEDVNADSQRRSAARIRAQVDAKAKDREQKEEDARKRAAQKAKDLAGLKSGTIKVTEILSDDEDSINPTSNKSSKRAKSNAPSHFMARKAAPERSSIPPQSPSRRTRATSPVSSYKPRGPDRSSFVPNGDRGSFFTTSTGFPRLLGWTMAAPTPISAKMIPDKPLTFVPIIDSDLSLHSDSPDVYHHDKETDDPKHTSPSSKSKLNNLAAPENVATGLEDTKDTLFARNDTKLMASRSQDSTSSGCEAKVRSPRKPREESQPQKNVHRLETDCFSNFAGLSREHSESNSHVLPTPALTPAALTEYGDDSGVANKECMGVPLFVVDIERLLQRHRDTLREHQEALVKTRLRRAQDQHLSFAGPSGESTHQTPFKDLFSGRTKSDAPSKKEKQFKIAIFYSQVPVKSGKKPSPAYLHASEFIADAQYVPKVKSIGRLGISRDLLARNVQTLNHMPWFPENEAESDVVTQHEQDRYEELRQRYTDSIQTRSSQRRCRAIGGLWAPEVMKLLTELGVDIGDVLYYMLHDDEREKPAAGTLSLDMEALWCERAEDCPSCTKGNDCRSSEWKSISKLLKRPPTERRLAMAGLLCEVFYRVLQMNIWHVVSDTSSALQLQQDCLKQLQSIDYPQSGGLGTFCYACGQFACTTHGAYVEIGNGPSNDESINTESASTTTSNLTKEASSDDDSRSGTAPEDEVILDDLEINANAREHAALPIRQNGAEQHQCGVFCLSTEVPLSEILGRRPDGSISGRARTQLLQDQSPLFDDLTLCDSEACFWDIENRDEARFATTLDESATFFKEEADRELYRTMLPSSLTSKRGPCELALAIPGTTCVDIFYCLLRSLHNSVHSEKTDLYAGIMHDEVLVDRSVDKTLESRRAFVPCAHVGPCQSDTCSCVSDKISCESSCGCSSDCTRRFRGCTCRDGRRKVCFEDVRCECWASNRECHPALCDRCGVEEVLDPVNNNKLNLDFLCKNNRIQLGIPKRTVMGVSEVHGWGLYAGEAITKHDFISEYKGELISTTEGDRRGTVYHNLGLEYLFKLSKDQELDGSRVSNKSRFINNSSLAKNINVLAKKLLCNGVSRIMLYAARDIAAGEELFYDYGYHKKVRANFKEKPDLVKRTMVPARTLSTTTSFTATTMATGMAEFLHSGPGTFPINTIDDLDELAPILPTSEPDSEFGVAEAASFSDSDDNDIMTEAGGSEESENSDVSLTRTTAGPSGLCQPKSRDNPSMKSGFSQNLSSSPPYSRSSRPKKRLRTSQPRVPIDQDSESDNPLSDKTSSRTLSQDNLARISKRVPPELRKRKISANDKRLGGDVQRKAAAARKARLEAERKAATQGSPFNPAGSKRKRSEAASSPIRAPGFPRSSKVKLSRPKQPTSRPSHTVSPAPLSPSHPALRLDDSDLGSAPMSESSCSASPNGASAKDAGSAQKLHLVGKLEAVCSI